MINFSCSRCNTEFSVEDSEAGKRAKCTRCGNIMRIPERSYRALQIVDEGGIFRNEELDSLYEAFLAENEEIIIQHSAADRENSAYAIVEIATRRFRSQVVRILMLDVNGDPEVIIFSAAGKVEYAEQAIAALQTVNLAQGLALELDEDSILNVGTTAPLRSYSDEDFNQAVLRVASFADILEDKIFGGDAN